MSKVTIKSDGTSEGTKVLVDDKPVDCIRLIVTATAGELPKVAMELYVDEIDFNGECLLHTSAVYKAHKES